MPLGAAVVGASGERLRPIVMTSAAFLLGVLPLVISQGGRAESRHSIGTGVFGGAIAATLLGLMFTPVLYYTVVSRTRAKGLGSELPRHREQGLPQTVEDSETRAP